MTPEDLQNRASRSRGSEMRKHGKLREEGP